MSWDWVSPVTGAVVGIVGIVTGYLTAKESQRMSAAAAQQGFDNQRRMALEERQQQRRGAAYVDFLVITEQLAGWAREAGLPFIGPASADDRKPSYEEQVRVFAALSAYGSDEVFAQAQCWREGFDRIHDAAIKIAWAREHPGDGVPVTHERKLLFETLLPADLGVRRRLGDLINAELSGSRGLRVVAEPSNDSE